MSRRRRAITIAIVFLLSGFGAGFGVGFMLYTKLVSDAQVDISNVKEQIAESKNPHYTIGIVYPVTGRLDWWGRDALPIIEAAESDVEAMLNDSGSSLRLDFLFADSNSTGEGALRAVKDLVAKGSRVIVGLPTSGEVDGVMAYLNESQIPAISSASTSSQLSRRDTVFRLSTPENYRAEVGAELAIEMGCSEVIVVYRNDGWGRGYSETVMATFRGKGLQAFGIPFEPSHTFYMNYSDEVEEMEAMIEGREGHTLVYLVAWENEDYSVLNEAMKSATLSKARWFSAALYPSLLEPSTMWGKARDLRSFAQSVGLLAPEQRPIVCGLTMRLMEEARSRLGHYPSYEHIYIYDAIMIAAQSLLIAGRGNSSLIEAIPQVAERYYGATGHKALDVNGDLSVEDTAFIGVIDNGDVYDFGYYAFHDGSRDEFTILNSPRERSWFFSPEA